MRISRLLWLLLMLVPATTFATPRPYEIIYIDGQQWWVKGWWPLDYIDSIHFADFDSRLPDDRVRSTGNWGGYACFWSLDGEWLLLDSVKYEVWDDKASESNGKSHWEKLPQATLREVFKDYCHEGRIVASWYTHTLMVGRGEMVYHDPDHIDHHFESEMLLEMKEGRLTKRTIYLNRVVVEGFDIDNLTPEQRVEFQQGFLPVLRRHPELDTVDRVYFTVKRCTIDSLGHLTVGEVLAHGRGTQPIAAVLEQEFRQYLEGIHPWKVWHLNGEYFTPLRGEWMMPFFLEKKGEN